MKNNRSLLLSEKFIAENKLSTLSPAQDSLFWKLWNACSDIADQALHTDFIQGIKNGDLDPVKYGGFNVSDAYYCFKGAEDYLTASSKATDPTLKAFLNKKYESYKAYNDTFPKTWHVKDAKGIVPLDICKQYSDFEKETVTNEAAIYALIVMLPCEYLWAWLGAKLSPPAKGNLYAKWISGNNDPSGAYAMGNFIEIYREVFPVDESLALDLYKRAMTFEYKNFKAATE